MHSISHLPAKWAGHVQFHYLTSVISNKRSVVIIRNRLSFFSSKAVQQHLKFCLSLNFADKRHLSMSRKKRGAAGAVQVEQTRLRVLLDMDQVLADFEGYFLTKYREKFPGEPFIPLEERKCFYLRDQYATLRPDLPDKTREIYNSKDFFVNLPEIEGAVDATKEIAQMEDVDVFICTSPLKMYEHCLQEKFKWVEDHLGVEWVDKVIIAKDKTMVNGHILIDDRPNIKGACKNPSWEHIVFSCCHNKTAKLGGKRRLENWTSGQWREIIEDFKKRI